MRLRLFDRLQRLLRRPAGSAEAGRPRSGGHRKRSRLPLRPRGREVPPAPASAGPPAWAQPPAGLRTQTGGVPPGVSRGPRTNGRESGGGGGRARIREAPFGSAPVTQAEVRASPAPGARAARGQPWYQVVGPPPPRHQTAARPREAGFPGRTALPGDAGLPLEAELSHEAVPAAELAVARPAAPAVPAARPAAWQRNQAGQPGQAELPFTPGHPETGGGPRSTGDGRANCGPLESILWRQWEPGTVPHPQAAAAVERLASFPRALQEKLADGLDGIFVGAGGVPDLDHMSELHGVPLPSGKATWDACAGAYGERKIVVGTRPSPTPDVVCHEVGHALDDLDSPPGKWQSDSPEFRLIYDQCRPYFASDFHRQRGGLGRKEFFADAFAAIASEQRPALVDMLNGNTRAALRVMLYFNRRYGI